MTDTDATPLDGPAEQAYWYSANAGETWNKAPLIIFQSAHGAPQEPDPGFAPLPIILSENDVRRIIREELRKLLDEGLGTVAPVLG